MKRHLLHSPRLFLGVLAVAVYMVALVLMRYPDRAIAQQSTEQLIWAADAMACVPNGATSRDALLDTSHGHARFAQGKTGNAYLICPFTDAVRQGAILTRIQMTFRDASNSRVTASLKLIDKRSGQVFTALSVPQACLIDSSQLGDPYWSCSGTSTGHRLDFQRYYYYVQLSLYRGSTTEDVRAVGVSLWQCTLCNSNLDTEAGASESLEP